MRLERVKARPPRGERRPAERPLAERARISRATIGRVVGSEEETEAVRSGLRSGRIESETWNDQAKVPWFRRSLSWLRGKLRLGPQ
jgi:hypothetical protein